MDGDPHRRGLIWLTGPDLFLLGLVVGAMEIAGGNVTLLLAVAIVAGFKRPWTWAFVILTKITPGSRCCGSRCAGSGGPSALRWCDGRRLSLSRSCSCPASGARGWTC